MSKMEQARAGSGFAILKNGFEQKVEIWRSYLDSDTVLHRILATIIAQLVTGGKE